MSSPNSYLLEACVDSARDAVVAQALGVHRIELCASLETGGLTPYFSLIRSCVRAVEIPVYVMIRPRAGDFLYDTDELEQMETDIRMARDEGAAGVVYGVLTAAGAVDGIRIKQLQQAAPDLPVTFHRAFDMTADPFKALETLISLNIPTVLTSGQQQTAADGFELIHELVKRAAGRIVVMAGSGVSGNTVDLLAQGGVKQFHFTMRKAMPSPMQYKNESLSAMGSVNAAEYIRYEADPDKVIAIKKQLRLPD